MMKFNANQLKALDIEKNIAVSAGAGSGKTRVLTSRYIKLLEEGNIKVSEIVAITFTNKAALEMKERIRKEIDKKIGESRDVKKWISIKEDIQMANISTIHSFCMNIVRENASLIGIDPEFSILDEYQGRTLLDKILKEELQNAVATNRDTVIQLIKEIGSSLSEEKLYEILKKEVKNIYSSIRSDGDAIDNIEAKDRKSKLILDVIKELDKRFTKIKYGNGVVDFSDLEFMAMNILKDEAIRKRYRSIYKKFLIDEFQDTNELQKKIIYSFVYENGILPGSLFVVGDHKQAIYGFRGTDFRVFRDVMRDIDNTVELDICYRSRPSIIRGINDSFKTMINNYEELKYPDNKALEEDKSINIYTLDCPGGKSREDNVKFDKIDDEIESKLTAVREKKFLYCHNREVDEEGRLVALSIVNLVEQGYKLRDMAVLLRSRSGLTGLVNELRNSNINYVVLGGLGFFEKQEVIDMMFIYNAVIKPTDRRALFGALRSPGFCINDEVLYKFNKLIMENNNDHSLDLIEKSISNSDYRDLSRALDILNTMRNGIAGKRAYDILQDILYKTNFHNKILAFEDGEKAYRNIEKLLSLATEFDKNPLLTPPEFCEYIREYSEASKEEEAQLDTESSDAVKIMTIHASKGLEFDCVILPYLNKGMGDRVEKEYKSRLFLYNGESILSKSDDEDTQGIISDDTLRVIEEEKRILYVAATRAKEKLVLIGKEKTRKSQKEHDSAIKNYLDIFRNSSNYIIRNVFTSIPSSSLSIVQKNLVDSNLENRILGFKIKMENKFNFSISRYFEYKSCGRKYYYKYVENIPEKYYGDNLEKGTGYGSNLGSAVHEILEHGLSEDVIREVSEKYNVDGKFLRKFTSSFKIIEEKYKDIYRDSKHLWSKSEQEIRYKYKNITFTGFIDRLDIYEFKGKYHAAIIDYKTNYIGGNLDKVIEKYTPQLTLYSLAVKDLIRVDGRKIEDVKTYLFLLDRDILKEIDSEKSLNDFNDIYNHMIKIDQQEDIEEFQKDLTMCSSCGYYKLCQVK